MQRLRNKLTKANLSKLCLQDIDDDLFPASPIPNMKSHDVVYVLLEHDEKRLWHI